MQRIFIKEGLKETGKKIKLSGWVDARRDHGKLIFIDLIDKTGVLQMVFNPQNKDILNLADTLRLNDVIEVEGILQNRPEKMINPKIDSGKVELAVENLKIINKSEVSPFDLGSDGYEINEEIRLKYRYLDLRRHRLHKNLEVRHKIIKNIRDFLDKENFIEIETPILTKSTPEGARDFIVPSRLHHGKFYALPQSPQQYKQLLMVAGVERYFQLARCFRDEDTRGDRQPEFTQLDIEMSFISQNDILDLVEKLVIELIEKTAGKKIYQKPFPRISYKEAIEKYKDDKFDLRPEKNPNLFALAWVVNFPLFERTQTKEITSSHHPFTAPKDEDIPLLDTDPMKARSWQHDLVCNGYELGGGSIRITNPKIQTKIFEILGHKPDEIQTKFGHLLKAFEYGVPPHGGIALGIDRLISLIRNEPNIREVIAFPKTGDGRDLMMDAPSETNPNQLKELGISVKKEERGKDR